MVLLGLLAAADLGRCLTVALSVSAVPSYSQSRLAREVVQGILIEIGSNAAR